MRGAINMQNKDYKELVAQLVEYSKRYYVTQDSPVSDEIYDEMYKEALAYEQAHPDAIDPNSPTQKIGEPPAEAFKKYKHPIQMYSLSKIYNVNEMRIFFRRFAQHRRDLGKSAVDNFHCSHKLDGVACDLIYNDGSLILALTRGDGIEGEDVTANANAIGNIPKHLNIPGYVYVRGEVIVYTADFAAINRERELANLPAFKNSRNYASGSLRQLDSEVTRQRRLKFYAWELIVSVSKKSLSIEQQYDYLSKLGFSVPRYQMCESMEDIVMFTNSIAQTRNHLPYDIDGAVIKQNDPKINEDLGYNQREPLWATAWKFASQGCETKIKAINWKVGRTGKLTPVASIEPVTINGSTISEVTLSNAAKVEELKIGPGAKVRVVKRGDVIPAIEEVFSKGKYEELPTKCPNCGHDLIRDGAELKCSNEECTEILISKLLYILGPGVLNVAGIGPVFIRDAVESKSITSVKDLFTPMESRSKDVSQDTLDQITRAAQNINLVELFMILGIPGLGKALATKLVMETGSLSALIKCLQNPSQLQDLLINESLKQGLKAWYTSKTHQEFLDYIASLKLNRAR